MMVLLRFDVLQRCIDLARAYRESSIPALPEKSAIPGVDILDPLRRCFLYLFDHLCLGKSLRQRRQNVNVIADTAYAQSVVLAALPQADLTTAPLPLNTYPLSQQFYR